VQSPRRCDAAARIDVIATLARIARCGAWLCAGFAALASAPAAADYPDKPIRLVVPFPAGGGADALARTIMPRVAQELGTTIVIDNRPGAGGNVGAEYVARAAPTATRCSTAPTARMRSTAACTRSRVSMRCATSRRCPG